MRQAVILAGGKGTRLASELGELPKPLVAIGEKPLLDHQLKLLCDHGYAEVVLMVNHRAEYVREWLSGLQYPIAVKLVDDGKPRGTAGAVLATLPDLEQEFLVMYGDTMLEVDLMRFEQWHRAEPAAEATLFLHPNDHPHDSDLVEIDGSSRILRFHGYPHPDGVWLPNLVNAALYIVRRDSLKPWSTATPPIDFAKDLFPWMLEAGAFLRGYNSPEYIKDVGTPSRLSRVRSAYSSGAIRRTCLDQPQRAVFLDRDGTLCAERGLIRRPQDLEVFDFAGSAIKRLNDAEWRTVLITNQAVVARGEVTEAELRVIHARLESQIAEEHAYLDRIYFCPHHPDIGFPGERAELKIDCNCRKPKPGLIFAAQHDLNIRLEESWFVGDSTADLGVAEATGVTSILVETGHSGRDNGHPFEPKFTVANVSSAADFILDLYPRIAALVSDQVERMLPGEDWFVGGLPRVGKTIVAAALERELRLRGRPAHMIHLDRWFVDPERRGRRLFGQFDFRAARDVLAKVAARRRNNAAVTITLPAARYKANGRGRESLEVTLAPEEIVIWDGLTALVLADTLAANDRAIEVFSDEQDRRARFAQYCQQSSLGLEDGWNMQDDPRLTAANGQMARTKLTLDPCALRTTLLEGIR